MAIVSTGQVAFSDIQTEFGGSNPISLSEYYSGGLGPASVPSSGEIQVSDFYGTSSVLFSSTWTAVTQFYSNPVNMTTSTLSGGPLGNFSSPYGSGNVAISVISNINTATFVFTLKATSGSVTFTNSGWSRVDFYVDQSNNSGSPNSSFNRTDATDFQLYNNGTSNAIASWLYSGSPGGAPFAFADHFGTEVESPISNFLELF
tara:strand:+ start:186 stop:794 length:609 start_codon:yes stop_codon:yes gene_type:complete